MAWIDLTNENEIEKIREMAKDANACVVTHPAFVQVAKEKLNFIQVFTPEQIKGLEYKNVILYKILDHSVLREVNKRLRGDTVKEDPKCSATLSACFVAATRATEELYGIEDPHDHSLSKVRAELKKAFASNRSNVEEPRATVHVSSPQEWAEKYVNCFQSGAHPQAKQILAAQFKEHGLQSPEIVAEFQKRGIVQQADSPKRIEEQPREKRRGRNQAQAQNPKATVKEISEGNPFLGFADNCFLMEPAVSGIIRNDDINGFIKHIKNRKWGVNSTVFGYTESKQKKTFTLFEYVALNTSKTTRILDLILSVESLDVKRYERNISFMNSLVVASSNARRSILNSGRFDVNARTVAQVTALHTAAEKGALGAVEDLLNANADPNCRDSINNTPLSLACYKGNTAVVERLLKEENIDYQSSFENGSSLLVNACIKFDKEIIKMLLTKMGVYNFQDKNPDKFVKAIEEGSYVKLRKHFQNSKVVSSVLKATYSEGNTLLHIACMKGDLKIIKFLLEKGAEVNACNLYNNTPLMLACAKGNEEVVKLLLEHKADIKKLSYIGCSHATYAFLQGHYKLLEFLLDQGAHVSEPRDLCVLMMVFESESRPSPQLIIKLVESGVCVNKSENKDKVKPLHYAVVGGVGCNGGDASIVSSLVNAQGIEVNVQDINGNTPLHLACEQGLTKVIEVLLKAAGIDIEIINKTGKTPLDIAKENKQKEIYRMILELKIEKEKRKKELQDEMNRLNEAKMELSELREVAEDELCEIQDRLESSPVAPVTFQFGYQQDLQDILPELEQNLASIGLQHMPK